MPKQGVFFLSGHHDQHVAAGTLFSPTCFIHTPRKCMKKKKKKKPTNEQEKEVNA
jgi:heme/copper-type cytochrome/quinol oxidase subunit 3